MKLIGENLRFYLKPSDLFYQFKMLEYLNLKCLNKKKINHSKLINIQCGYESKIYLLIVILLTNKS